MKKAVQYIRISEKDQSNFSISGQQDYNKSYADKNNMQIVGTYIDDGKSARNFDRPAWKEIHAVLKSAKNEVDFLIVTKYDRLIRNAAEGLATIHNLENRYGVRVLSVMENINIDPHSPFFFKMRADILVNAEFERRVISDRTKFGVYQARKSGRFIGRAPVGYLNASDESGKPVIVVDKKRAWIVRKVFEEYTQGVPVAEIRKRAARRGMVVKGKSGFERIVSNVIYIGQVEVPAYKDNAASVTKGSHSAIVSLDLYQKAQDRLNGGRKYKRKIVSDELPLRGVIQCHDCQQNYSGGRSKGRSKYYYYYRCLSCNTNLKDSLLHEQFAELLDSLSYCEEDFNNLLTLTKAFVQQSVKERKKHLIGINRDIEVLQEKVNSLEEKYILDQIAGSTYKKWHGIYSRDLLGKKVEAERFTDEAYRIYEGMDKLSGCFTDLQALYNRLETTEKHTFVRLMFPRGLYRTKNTYRTAHIMPLFSHNSLNIKHLHIEGVSEYTLKKANFDISTRKGNSYEPFLSFLHLTNNANYSYL